MLSSGPHSCTLICGWLLQFRVSFNLNKSSPVSGYDRLCLYLYLKFVVVWMFVCVCVFCELSLPPNSLSLIGCVILGKDKEGYWRGAWGGGNQGNERALPITAWPVASLPYKGTLILHIDPVTSAIPSLLHSFPTLARPLKKKNQLKNLSCQVEAVIKLERSRS